MGVESGNSNHGRTVADQSPYEIALQNCCFKCLEYLTPGKVKNEVSQENNNANQNCWLCLGLWQTESASQEFNGSGTATGLAVASSVSSLRKALEECCRPYGGFGPQSQNQFSQLTNQSHTVSLSGELCLRYKWLVSLSPPLTNPLPFSIFLQDLKQHLYARIDDILQSGGGETTHREAVHNGSNQWIQDHEKVFGEEEQGSLTIHLLCLPPRDHPMTLALNEFLKKHKSHQKTKKQHKRYNKRQKCGPFITQGGDPRQNLEVRLRSRGYDWISQSTAEELSSAKTISSLDKSMFLSSNGNDTMQANASSTIEYHVAVFRRPIFLYGYYTKSRRDVSQSPFVVMREKVPTTEPNNNNTSEDVQSTSLSTKEATTLGVTSVEEEICGPIRNLLGVSTRNNLQPDSSSNGGGGVVYGMIKFHASGREDMDVRMLVRSESPTCHGRPFCVQIVDALRPIVSQDQLQELVNTINQTTPGGTTIATTADVSGTPDTGNHDADVDSSDGLCHSGASYYGQNPMGVGIFPGGLKPVPAAVFSGLQKDTESKTKHYGCYCWSKSVLPVEKDLTKVLFRNVSFPLTIKQRTPFRVLHRRSNLIRERNVLHARATRIDNHHFRLELSTQAGTYVKEFVYGDFGRTVPSVSSLMGCKTGLLKLDCEGIEIPLEEQS